MKKTIYFANNIIEADSLVNYLKRHDIQSCVDRKSNEDKTGMIKPTTIVEVLVDLDVEEAALKVVRLWKEERVREEATKSSPKIFRYLLVAFILGAGLTVWHYESKYVFSTEHEENRLTDKGLIYKNDTLVRWERDLNEDGKIDEIFHYDRSGKTVMSESDFNFNGIFETKTIYENDVISMMSVDADEDNKLNHKNYYEKGRWYKTEHYDYKTGNVFKIDTANGIYITESKIDEDKDGSFDKRLVYNQYFMVVKEEKIND